MWWSGKKNVKKTANKTKSSCEAGSKQPVTSQPTAAAAGDTRASSVKLQMMKTVRESRQQINELRERTENALAYIHRVNEERRQQAADIQCAKDQLNQLHAKIAKIISYNVNNTEVASSEPPVPDNDEAST